MSKHSHDKKNFTADDIRRYLHGQMSREEMHQLEMAALEDPFLADAIDGMRLSNDTYGTGSFDTELNELRGRLNKKQARVNIGVAWRVAAILVVVVTGIALTYLLQRGDLQEKPVVSEVRKTQAEPKADTANDGVESQVAIDTPARVQTGSAASAQKRVSRKAPNEESAKNEALLEMEDVISETPSKDVESSRVTVSPASDSSLDQPQQTQYEEVSKNAEREVNDQLQGRAAGVNVGRAGKRSEFHSNRFEPEGGWSKFHEYVSANQNVPDSVLAVHGITKVEFTIDSAGGPSQIRFKQPLTPAHSHEVLRLLQNGPRWKILRGRERTVEIEITF